MVGVYFTKISVAVFSMQKKKIGPNQIFGFVKNEGSKLYEINEKGGQFGGENWYKMLKIYKIIDFGEQLDEV